MEGIRYNKFSSGLYLTCPDNDMEMSPSWSRAHDWKSCNRQKRFESSNLSISATLEQAMHRLLQFFVYGKNPAEMRGFLLFMRDFGTYGHAAFCRCFYAFSCV